MANTACVPFASPVCKVELWFDAFKYAGKCFVYCGCDCPKITIWMNRVDALPYIKQGKAQFAADDAECTPCGSCCQRALARAGG